MKQIVIYDSYFGNTAVIAEEIAKTLECDHIKVHAFNSSIVNNYDVVVVGSPTRAFGPTKEIKNLVKKLTSSDMKIAFFDTRMDMEQGVPKMIRFMASKFGYSNDTLEKIISKKNLKTCITSEMFFVKDTEGPLHDNEIEKARQFAKNIKES